MTAMLKRDCPPEIIRKIDRIETRADKCYRNLALLRLPWNVAAWVALTDAIRIIELNIPPHLYGSRHHINATTNQSMVAAQIYKFVRKYAAPQAIDIVPDLHWTPRIAAQARQAFEISRGYLTFCIAFPYWHADKYAGELVDDSVVRFVSYASTTGRRITAYQQGIRPRNFGATSGSTVDATPVLQRLFSQASNAAVQISPSGVTFPDIRQLQKELYNEQERRTLAMRRRYPDIRIGGYSLDDFRKFYSGINAVASAHEFLCYLWSQEHGLPTDSLLMVEHRSHWVSLLSGLTNLAREQIYEMLKDVTFGRVHAVDFHLLPFVPLNREGAVLALAPFCSLSANWEENVLGCLSRRDSDLYSCQSLTKEDEMRRPLIALTSGTRLITGGHKLPKGIPDIDLIVQDLEARVLILCELKWCRKPSGRLAREDRDQEVLKGFSQIKRIRDFIQANPKHLLNRGYIAWDISIFNVVHYCVVARDHFVEPPSGSPPLYSYDAFVMELKNSGNTIESLRSLQSLTWLPVEGVDFTVRFERSRAGDVALESEVFYPAGGPITNAF
jgi:hypothetical protein